jgi:hypothetical protein
MMAEDRLESKIKEKIREVLPHISQKTLEDVKQACFVILVRTEKEEGVDLPANRFLKLYFDCEEEAKKNLPEHIEKWVIF